MATKNQTKDSDNFPVPVQDKPLNQTQLKNLRELVHGDFFDLKQQVEIDIDRRLKEKEEEIKERYKDVADLEAARKRFVDLAREFEDRARELVEEVTNGSGSITVKHGYTHRLFSVDVEEDYLVQEGKDEELQKARSAANAMKQTAARVLSREQRQIDRQCLLQGISATGAHELIRDLPQAEDIMPLVGAELALHNEKDAHTLMSAEEFKALETEKETE